MNTKIVARHSSGKWLRADTPAFDKNVKRMRNSPTRVERVGCSLVTRTEGADPEAKKSLQIPEDGWGVFQPHNKVGDGLTDCSIEWLQAQWRMIDAGVEILTQDRIRTEKGFLLPPSQMPWVLLVPRDHVFADQWKYKQLLVSAAHNNLDNTPTRARAWRTEGDSFVQFQIRHRGPHVCRFHNGDINKDFRNRQERKMVREHFLRGTGMTNGWSVVRGLPAAGTHGRQILDQPFSNARVRAYLMADDVSSDHRPTETVLG